jgi:hypothetical protein
LQSAPNLPRDLAAFRKTIRAMAKRSVARLGNNSKNLRAKVKNAYTP